jgi:ribosomal protein S27E
MKPKKHGQSSKRPTRSKGTETVCPRCRKKVILDIKYPDAPKGSEEVECQVCGATLDVKYICSLEVDDVEVVDTPIPEVECPVCDTTLTLDDADIDSETGSTELDCPGGDDECGAELEVLWKDWGRETEVEVLSEPEKEKEEERTRRRREAVKRYVKQRSPEEEEEEEDEDEDDDEDEDNSEGDDDDDADDDDGNTDQEDDDEDL